MIFSSLQKQKNFLVTVSVISCYMINLLTYFYLKTCQELNYQMEKQSATAKRAQRFKSIRQSAKLSIPSLSKNSEHLKHLMDGEVEKEKFQMNIHGSISDEPTSFRLKTPGMMSQFQEKYQMLQKIGQGANGVVRKCLHRKNGIVYAVKSMNIDEQHIYFLKRNFYHVQELNHSSIIKYKSLYIDRKKNLCNLVMEYVNWPNLLNVYIESQQEIKKIMYDLFETISYLHNLKICHRDIKPQNILYNQQTKQIKIIDFGISKKLVSRNFTKQLLTFTGTLFYKAPQMFLGGGYSERVDEWAAGVTLFKLITKVTPFESEFHHQTIQNIKRKQVCFQQHIWQDYSKHAQDLLIRIFKESNQRLSASEAMKHFWFTTSVISPRLNKMTRSMTLVESNEKNQIENKSLQFTDGKIQRMNSSTIKEEEDTLVKKWLQSESNKDNIDSDEQNNLNTLKVNLFSKKIIQIDQEKSIN